MWIKLLGQVNNANFWLGNPGYEFNCLQCHQKTSLEMLWGSEIIWATRALQTEPHWCISCFANKNDKLRDIIRKFLEDNPELCLE